MTFPQSVLPFLYLLYIFLFSLSDFLPHLFLESTFCAGRFHALFNFLKDPWHSDKPCHVLVNMTFSSVIVLKRQPAWSVVLYVFEQGSSQSVLVSKTTRPTLERCI